MYQIVYKEKKKVDAHLIPMLAVAGRRLRIQKIHKVTYFMNLFINLLI